MDYLVAPLAGVRRAIAVRVGAAAGTGVVWAGTAAWSGVATLQYMAALGQGFFVAVVGTELALVLLAAPAATAGAICLDRARGTLSHMLMTDLSAAEIVLGKLAARLTPVLAMICCTLPMLELLSLLGGIDPQALLGSFVVAVGLAVLGCSLAMVLSLWVGTMHEALLCTYGISLLGMLAGPMTVALGSTIGWPWLAPPPRSDPFCAGSGALHEARQRGMERLRRVPGHFHGEPRNRDLVAVAKGVVGGRLHARDLGDHEHGLARHPGQRAARRVRWGTFLEQSILGRADVHALGRWVPHSDPIML